MNFREREVKIAYIREAILCITTGTVIGLVVYQIFLYLTIVNTIIFCENTTKGDFFENNSIFRY